MAQRSNTPETTPANEILATLVEMTKETEKVTLRALELESATPVKALLSLLDELENAGKIDSSGRGDDTLIWVKDSTPATPKKTRRTKAQMDAAKAEANERNAYNAKAAESQDPVTNEGEPFHTPEAAEDFATMGKGEAPDTSTDMASGLAAREAEGLTGDAYLYGTQTVVNVPADASIRLLSENDEWIKPPLVTLPKPFQPEFHESDIVKNGLALDEPEFIPEKPEGVNDNTWYMAHAAITQTARDWWMDRANDQCAEYLLAAVMAADTSA